MNLELFKELNLIEADHEHKTMLKEIKENLPMISKVKSNFCKTQSQFMDNMLTVSNTTPLRNMRQISAEVTRSISALKEAYFKTEKDKTKIKIKELEASKLTGPHKELILIEIEEIKSRIIESNNYVNGAIRKIKNYIDQHNSIKDKFGDINERDFEKEEEKYHIQKAFEQALVAARSRNGIIDEGNHIYLMQIGINGAIAQRFITDLLKSESDIISEGKIPSHKLILNFLEEMSDFFKGCSMKYSDEKGMTTENKSAMIGK